jgi:ubiquinol-cytochrome c reductase cytochrome b subunit
VYRIFFWILVVDVLILGYCGQAHITPITLALGQVAAAYYFAHFLIILPLVSKFERPRGLPMSISESVLHGEKQESAPFGLATTGGSTTAPAAAE